LTTPQGPELLSIRTTFTPAATALSSAGATVGSTANAAVQFDVDFRPDGSSTGGTVFVTDVQNLKPWRVLVVNPTGSSYARQGW